MIEVKLINDAPIWFVWLTSLGPFFVGLGSLTVAIAVACIARQQLETNRTAVKIADKKRDDDLFDRRLIFFTEFTRLVTALRETKEISPGVMEIPPGVIKKFNTEGGAGGRFLFDDTVSAELIKFVNTLVEIHQNPDNKSDNGLDISDLLEAEKQSDIRGQMSKILETFDTPTDPSGDTDETPPASS